MDTVIKIVLADDHILLRNALAELVDGFGDCKVVYQAGTGREVIRYLSTGDIPHVAILDLNMPDIDGFETAEWIRQHFPEINILMLTMYDSELSLIRLLQSGVKGFLRKDIHPSELKFAIRSVVRTGFYYSSNATGRLVNLFRNNKESNNRLQHSILTLAEIKFLKLACTDLTYKEIAQQMVLNPRSVDTLRDQLFVKLDVKSRVGLAMIAVKHGIVTF